MTTPDTPKKSIEALTPETLAELLRKSGSRTATAAAIRAMIAAGAPVNPDGTISFVKFTAYLEGRHNGNLQ